MFLPFQPLAMFMGTYTRKQADKVMIDSSWWQNDGIVNTRSMRAPAGHPSATSRAATTARSRARAPVSSGSTAARNPSRWT